MTASYRHRRARPDDDRALATLDAQTWSPAVTPAPRPAPDRAFFGRVDPADVLVAEVEGQVVGYVTLRQGIDLPSHAHVLEVQGLAVSPDAQGRGLGRSLVEAAKEEARRRGARKLSLRVLAPNHSARRLYESCGFVVEGVLAGEFVLDEVPVDDFLMACDLTGDRLRS